ncbi:type II secretion system protein, partial [Candidatus Uhrbacteria bacterium]|nr:type II secretion system protein [Candidatus Uhrbacteria bacterium]
MPGSRNKRGFTLIELLIVIGIIGFLAAAILVAVDPVKRIQDARDARRFAEVNALLNAILNKQVDDRQIYSGPSDAPIITSAANSQVIVTSTSGIECDLTLTENFPGCGQTLDTTTRPVAGTTSSTGTAVTGTGSDYTTSLRVGDTLTDGTNSCVVRSITDATNLVCVAAASPGDFSAATVRAASKDCVVNLSDTFTGVGTAAATASTTVTGTNTNFTAQVVVGDTLTSSNGNTCLVTAVAGATSLTCSTAVTFTSTYTITKANSLIPTYLAEAPIDPRGSGST